MFYKLLIASLLIVVGVAIGRYTLPEKVSVKTVESVKTVTVVQHDIQTVTIEKPDGTKTTTTVDRSVDNTHRVDNSSTTKVTENYKPQWHLEGQLVPQSGLLGPVYGLSVEKRLLGPIFIGAFGNTDREFGLSVGVEL